MRQFIILTMLTIFNYGHSQDTLRVKAYDGLGNFEYLTFKVSEEVYSKIPDSIKNKKKLLKEQLFTQLFMYKLKMKNPTSYTPVFKSSSASVFYSDSRQEIVASFPYKAQNGYGNYLLDEAYIDLYPNKYTQRALESALKHREDIRKFHDSIRKVQDSISTRLMSRKVVYSFSGAHVYDDGEFNGHKLGSLDNVLILFENCATYTSTDIYTITKGPWSSAIVEFKGNKSKYYITPYLRKTVIKAIKNFK